MLYVTHVFTRVSANTLTFNHVSVKTLRQGNVLVTTAKEVAPAKFIYKLDLIMSSPTVLVCLQLDVQTFYIFLNYGLLVTALMSDYYFMVI